MATGYLKEQGFTVMERNFRTPTGEIDIIAKKDGILHFFEVKARADGSYGTPFDALTPAKRRRIRQTANWYLTRARSQTMPCLFGVIGIDLSEEPAKIECILDAFD